GTSARLRAARRSAGRARRAAGRVGSRRACRARGTTAARRRRSPSSSAAATARARRGRPSWSCPHVAGQRLDDLFGRGTSRRRLFGAELGRSGQRAAERHLLEEPGESEGDDGYREAPEKDAVEGVGEGLQEVRVHGRRELPGGGGTELDAAAEPLDDGVREVRKLAGEPRGEDRAEDRDAEGAADGAEEGGRRGRDADVLRSRIVLDD